MRTLQPFYSRSRAEFAQLVAAARKSGGARPEWQASPLPSEVGSKDQLFPGTRYRVVRDIARSPMSVVHEAQHVDLRGASDRAIAHQTRHRSLATLGGYVRVHTAWTDNAATPLGL